MKRVNVLLLAVIMVFSLLAACSKSPDPQSQPSTQTPSGQNNTGGDNKSKTEGEAKPPHPETFEGVTLKVAWPYDEASYHARFDGIAEKLKLELVMIPAKGTSEVYQELFAQDIIPDIMVDNYGYLWVYQDLDIIEPLDELAKQHNFDFSQVNPALMSYLRAQDPQGRTMAIPDGANYFGLFYNKKVFDKFNVPYPDPVKPMTWNEVFELAKKMTAKVDGVQYSGFQFGYNVFSNRQMLTPLMQFAVNATDPKTGELRLTKDPVFTRYLELMKRYFETPGFFNDETRNINLLAFGRGAMAIHYPQFLMESDRWGDLKFARDDIDIAPFPVWEDMPNTGHFLMTGPIMINKHSKQKDAAFHVLMEYMSKENQARIIRPATTGTVLNDKEFMTQFGADHEGYKGKNVKALFLHEPARHKEGYSRWDQAVSWSKILQTLFESPDRDVQTVLRQAEDEARGKVKEMMDKAK